MHSLHLIVATVLPFPECIHRHTHSTFQSKACLSLLPALLLYNRCHWALLAFASFHKLPMALNAQILRLLAALMSLPQCAAYASICFPALLWACEFLVLVFCDKYCDLGYWDLSFVVYVFSLFLARRSKMQKLELPSFFLHITAYNIISLSIFPKLFYTSYKNSFILASLSSLPQHC